MGATLSSTPAGGHDPGGPALGDVDGRRSATRPTVAKTHRAGTTAPAAAGGRHTRPSTPRPGGHHESAHRRPSRPEGGAHRGHPPGRRHHRPAACGRHTPVRRALAGRRARRPGLPRAGGARRTGRRPGAREAMTAARTAPSRPTGLPSADAARLLREHGPNTVTPPRPRRLPTRILRQLADPLVALLLAAAVVTTALDDV